MSSLANPDYAEELRSLMQQVRDPTQGICTNFSYRMGVGYAFDRWRWLKRCFKALRLDDEFPVPHPDIQNVEDAYDATHDMWSGPYGENRHYLLQRLIDIAEGTDPMDIKIVWPFPPPYEYPLENSW